MKLMFLRKTLDWGHHLVKVTYDYMLELAARKNAMLFLFIVAFVESSFFPIPPDIMLPRRQKLTVLRDWLRLPACWVVISAISSVFSDMI